MHLGRTTLSKFLIQQLNDIPGAQDLGALTVGVITKPFTFEGNKRRIAAEEGLRVSAIAGSSSKRRSRTRSGGARSTSPFPSRTISACGRKCSRTCRAASCSCWTASRALIRAIRCQSAS